VKILLNNKEICEQYYIDNRKDILKKRSIYYQNNIDKIKQKNEIYRNQNKEKLNQYNINYFYKNYKKLLKSNRKRYYKNRQKYLDQKRTHLQENNKQINIKRRERDSNKRDFLNKQQRDWRENNPEKALQNQIRYLEKIGKSFLMTGYEFNMALLQWSKAVKKRDGYRCIWCGSIEYLEADHIKRKIQFPELALDISNGRTLCKKCHKKRHKKGDGLSKY